MDSDETPAYAIRNINSSRLRTRNSNEIRNLNVQFSKSDCKNASHQTRSGRKPAKGWWFLKLLLIAVCLAGFIAYEKNYNLSQDLQNHYYTAYERLSQLTNDLCTKRQANFTPILEAIERNVVGQRHIHDEIDSWFQTGNGQFSCALFVGGRGVGKSFTANLIVKHYPYPEYVLIIAMKELANENKPYTAFKMALFKILRKAITHGKCKHYLIVLDNLSPNDMPLLKKISDRLRTVGNMYQLVLHALFVFQGTGQQMQHETIRDMIPEARIITFISLGPNDLEHCIRRKASAMGIDLSARGHIVQLVANQINVTRYGCKPVRAKISMFVV